MFAYLAARKQGDLKKPCFNFSKGIRGKGTKFSKTPLNRGKERYRHVWCRRKKKTPGPKSQGFVFKRATKRISRVLL
mgnify:CR=1 FL=1